MAGFFISLLEKQGLKFGGITANTLAESSKTEAVSALTAAASDEHGRLALGLWLLGERDRQRISALALSAADAHTPAEPACCAPRSWAWERVEVHQNSAWAFAHCSCRI